MADKKISELTTASEIKNSDNLELSQDTGSGLVSLKATILAIANKMLNGINFTSDLQTTEKTVIGAINEVAQGGGGSSTLDGLTDVDIDDTTLADGQALVYNGTSEKWENGQGGGGTGGHTIIDENGNSMTARSGLQFFGAVEVTDDSENNRTLVEVLGGNFYNPVIYSTEEREIGVWTDGKPLYKRTYELSSSFVINAQTWGTTSIDVSFVDKIIGEADIVTAGGQGYVCFTDISNNNLQLYNPSKDAGIGVKFVTIQYTKLTDTAGSGNWTPQGVPTHHYSTDEQIIGTWIDGSTLYEKTIDLGENPLTVSYSSYTTSSITVQNANKLIRCEGCSTSNVYASYIAYFDNNVLKVQTPRNGDSMEVKIFTLQYTKTS